MQVTISIYPQSAKSVESNWHGNAVLSIPGVLTKCRGNIRESKSGGYFVDFRHSQAQTREVRGQEQQVYYDQLNLDPELQGVVDEAVSLFYGRSAHVTLSNDEGEWNVVESSARHGGGLIKNAEQFASLADHQPSKTKTTREGRRIAEALGE